jgi:hypothetical protein
MTSRTRLVLRCRPGEWIDRPEEGKHYKVDLDLHVFDEEGQIQSKFELMCASIYEDIQNPDGSGATVLDNIRRVELSNTDLIEAGGNAWYTHIERDRVWFEGQYSQGEGGEVSLRQYKLAVQTYLRFLADPEHAPIEVEFPLS